ncbi:hypothetical protein [Candidatus Bandiella numerosa]|uniref:hypothetical protein n=1 Tax=Candidatus Bandiella numerosa TaxID=2570586 RepID=UPI001F24EA3E|nr:hypothetical protein [Candidatus Bandiella numerosa]
MSTGNNDNAITNKPNINQEFKCTVLHPNPNPNVNSNIEKKKFIEALDEFNATLLSSMLEPIYENIEPDPLTGGGFAEETLNHFLINEYAKEITKERPLHNRQKETYMIE